MAGIATTNHENAGSAGILPVFLWAFLWKCAFKEATSIVGRYTSKAQLGLPSDAEEVSGRLSATTAFVLRADQAETTSPCALISRLSTRRTHGKVRITDGMKTISPHKATTTAAAPRNPK